MSYRLPTFITTVYGFHWGSNYFGAPDYSFLANLSVGLRFDESLSNAGNYLYNCDIGILLIPSGAPIIPRCSTAQCDLLVFDPATRYYPMLPLTCTYTAFGFSNQHLRSQVCWYDDIAQGNTADGWGVGVASTAYPLL